MHMYGEPLEPLLVGVPLNISGITHGNTKHLYIYWSLLENLNLQKIQTSFNISYKLSVLVDRCSIWPPRSQQPKFHHLLKYTAVSLRDYQKRLYWLKTAYMLLGLSHQVFPGEENYLASHQTPVETNSTTLLLL